MLIETSSNTPVNYYFRKVDINEIKANRYNKHNGWDFNWAELLEEEFEIFSLITDKHFNPPAQGLIALKSHRYPSGDGYVNVQNISSAPNNKARIKGKRTIHRTYRGVGKCLVAFACQYSIEIGLKGFVDLESKTVTREFYRNLGAKNIFGDHYAFDDQVAMALSAVYFKGGILWR